MSLVAVLRNPQHPVTQWMHTQCPDWPYLWSQWVPQCTRGPAPVMPTVTTRYPWAMVGRAWQFGFVLRGGLRSLNDTTARYGAVAWAGWPPDPQHWIVQAWRRLQSAGDAWLSRVPPAERNTDPRFWSLCWTLAHWEAAYRSGRPNRAIEVAWRQQRPIPLPPVVQDDLIRMTQRFAPIEYQWLHSGRRMIFDPSMPDGDWVAGADGDCIVGKTLWDFKVTLHPDNHAWWRNAIYQLIGYVMLDQSDLLKIRQIGLALPRQGIAWQIPIATVLAAHGRRQSLAAWRREFAHVLWQAQAHSSMR